MRLNKKGVIDNLAAMVVPIVAVAIILTIGFLILAEGKAQIVSVDPLGNDSLAYNATEEVQKAMDDIPAWLPIIIITMIGALLIALVSRFRNN